jgi:hypothetical protein
MMSWSEYNPIRPLRTIAAMLGVSVGSLVLAAVTVLFNTASRMPWLAPTEANTALLARCDKVQGTAPHRACVEAVIAAVQSRGTDLHLAANAAPSQPAHAHN